MSSPRDDVADEEPKRPVDPSNASNVGRGGDGGSGRVATGRKSDTRNFGHFGDQDLTFGKNTF